MFDLRRLFSHKDVHEIKNKWQSDLLETQRKSRELKESSKETLDMIKSSRMYKIAVSTGGKNRGLE